MTKEKQIEEIIEHFDWERVSRVMVALKWTWGARGEIPAIGKLVNKARGMLDRVWKDREKAGSKEYTVSTGGFRAECIKFDDGTVRLRLAFEVADWDTFELEDKE